MRKLLFPKRWHSLRFCFRNTQVILVVSCYTLINKFHLFIWQLLRPLCSVFPLPIRLDYLLNFQYSLSLSPSNQPKRVLLYMALYLFRITAPNFSLYIPITIILYYCISFSNSFNNQCIFFQIYIFFFWFIE